MRHFADPNVFFGTTIIFPNSVDRGEAHGFDVRLDLPRRGAFSGYLGYTYAKVVQYGPIDGGLFLEDDVIEIGPGTQFTPDHDQRHVAVWGLGYEVSGLWLLSSGRYESGTPLEVGRRGPRGAAIAARGGPRGLRGRAGQAAAAVQPDRRASVCSAPGASSFGPSSPC